jgi:hypothetical protein
MVVLDAVDARHALRGVEHIDQSLDGNLRAVSQLNERRGTLIRLDHEAAHGTGS